MKLQLTTKSWSPMALSCLLTISALAGPPTPQLQTTDALLALPGRTDRLALNGSVTIKVNAASVPSQINWFKDGQSIGTTSNSGLQLQLLGANDTGNYHAEWITRGLTARTDLLPLSVGRLPASHFGEAGNTVGQPEMASALELLRQLPDGRILARKGGFSTSHILVSPDLADIDLLHEQRPLSRYLSGVMNDGSYFLTDIDARSAFRYASDGTRLQFELPPSLSAANSLGLRHAVDRGAHGLILFNTHQIVGATAEGETLFVAQSSDLGIEFIDDVIPLPDGRLVVHSSSTRLNDTHVEGFTLVLGSDGIPDPGFSPIFNSDALAPPLRLRDGTWARLEWNRISRFAEDGTRISSWALPAERLTPFLELTEDGVLWGKFPGLGLVRYAAGENTPMPDFFIPDGQLGRIDAPLQLQSGELLVISGSSSSSNLADLTKVLHRISAVEDHTSSGPVVGQNLFVLDEGLYDLEAFYKDLETNPQLRPVDGQPYQVYCPFFGADATATWVPLDATTAPESPAPGIMRIPSFGMAYAGRYQLVVENKNGRALGPILDLRPRGETRLVNLSGRSRIDAAERAAVAGFVLRNKSDAALYDLTTARLLLRGVGPTLTEFGVNTPLENPMLRLATLGGDVFAENDDWENASSDVRTTGEKLGAFSLPSGSRDAALLPILDEQLYTVSQTGVDNASGVALTEIYLDDPEDDHALRLTNLSLRGWAADGDDALIAGFVIDDPDNYGRPLTLLVRAVGQTLSEFGVENPIANPTLQIFNRGGNEVAANDDWRNAPNPTELAQVFTSLGAFQLPPLSTDAAVKVTLPPGAYTAVVTPAADETATGIALLEIYVITEAE